MGGFPMKRCLLPALFLATTLCSLSAVEIIKDIPFLGPERAEKMDAYLPPERYERPVGVVLLIHGGGWKIGDKASAREKNIGTQLAEDGFAVFSVNYLLNKAENADGSGKVVKVAWPQNLYDCKSALRYLRKEHAKYGINPEKIAVMGGSAGGSMSMLIGVTENVEELNKGGLYTEEGNGVSCIIDFYGIPEMRGNNWSRAFAGATPEETAKNAALASPAAYFRKDMPPILIAHGTADKTVPVETSRELEKQLKALGVDCTYIEVPDAPHTFHLQPPGADLRPAVVEFLKKHLGAPVAKP